MARLGLFLGAITMVLCATANVRAQPAEPLRVLMTVGGVDYNTGIVRRLRQHENLELIVHDFDNDPAVFTAETLSGIDAVLMYHRDNTADTNERAALQDFLNAGGGVVVLHHAIANYPDWEDWWRRNLGGLYVLASDADRPPSRYFPNFDGVAVKTEPHPITRRFNTAWRYQDESYDDLWISNKVRPLLRTTAFGSEAQLAWIGPSKDGRVIYIQPGHGERIMREAIYLNLLEDALIWTSGQEVE